MATAQATTDHDEIRNWVEARGGHPARVKATGSRNDPGILRIDFPGFSGEDTLEEIEWDEFFEWFDRDNLALLLSDEAGNRFNKLVSRDTAVESPAARSRAASSKKKSSAKKSTGKKSTAKKSSKSSRSSKSSSSSKRASTTKRTNTTKRTTSKKASSKKASSKTSKARPASRRKPSAKK